MNKELIEELEKFSPDGEIQKLKEMLANPDISEGQRDVVKETIREWIAWQNFKIGSQVILLIKKKGGAHGNFANAKVVSKSTSVPMVKVEVEDGPTFLISPSILGNREDYHMGGFGD